MWPKSDLDISPETGLLASLDALQEICSLQAVPWVAVLELLLRRPPPDWPDGYRWDEGWALDVQAAAEEALEGSEGPFVDESSVLRLRDALVGLIQSESVDREQDVREAVFAHSLAWELDESGRASMSTVSRPDRYRLRPGRLAPRLRGDRHVLQFIPSGLNTRVEDVDLRETSRTPGFFIAGEDVSTPNYIIDFTAAAGLRRLVTKQGPVRAGVVIPVQDFDEVEVVDLGSVPGDDNGRRHLVRGISSAARDVAMERVQAAADLADIILLPEYCALHDDDFDAAKALVRSRSPLVVAVLGTGLVCGCDSSGSVSEHRHEAAASVLLKVGGAVQRKLQPARAKRRVPSDLEAGGELVDSLEAVGEGHGDIVILADPIGTSITVLICRDAFYSRVIRTLTDLGVGWVLVPMMSKTATTVAQHLSGMAAAAQTIGLLANAPNRWPDGASGGDRTVVALRGPYRVSPPPEGTLKGDDYEAPFTVVFDIGEGRPVEEP